MSLHSRAWRLLAGDDQPDRPGLPLAELLAPLPIVLLAILFVNDWILKPTSLPHWFTGKLSDFAGLAVFPLVATAVLDLVLWVAWRLGANVDFTLRRWKLVVMIALTGWVFTAMKLFPEVAVTIASILGFAFKGSQVMPDPTDLIALPALAFSWLWGKRAIARIAHGRMAWVGRSNTRVIVKSGFIPDSSRSIPPATDPIPIHSAFDDAVACGANHELVKRLDRSLRAWLEGGPIDPAREALARLRG